MIRLNSSDETTQLFVKCVKYAEYSKTLGLKAVKTDFRRFDVDNHSLGKFFSRGWMHHAGKDKSGRWYYVFDELAVEQALKLHEKCTQKTN